MRHSFCRFWEVQTICDSHVPSVPSDPVLEVLGKASKFDNTFAD